MSKFSQIATHVVERVLIVPGLGNSGPGHWQSLWQADNPAFRRVRQRHWDQPQLESWARRVKGEVEAEDRPALLVAHSFGCLATVRAAAGLGRRVAGALLAAPADPDKFQLAARLPQQPLHFPCVLAASRSDPWLSFDKAYAMSRHWGAEFVDAGDVGHLNVAAGFGPWPLGEALLLALRRRIHAVPSSQDCRATA